MRASNVFSLIVMAHRRFYRAFSPDQGCGLRARQESLRDIKVSNRLGSKCSLGPILRSFLDGALGINPSQKGAGRSGPGSGFSLIELMVVLAVVSILLGVAVPAYQSFVDSTAVTTASNDLIAAINIARSEALKRDGIVSVQALDTTSKDFSDGYCVVLDSPGNCTGALRQFTVGSDEITLVISGGYSSVSFDGLGGLSGTSGAGRQFNLCRGNEDYRLIDIKLVGRPALTGLDACP